MPRVFPPWHWRPGISAGLLADRLGRRLVLMSALMISAIGGVIVALAPTSSLYLLGRGLAGVGLGAVTAFASQGTQPSTSLGQQALAIAAPSYASAFGIVMMSTGVISLIVAALTLVMLPCGPVNRRFGFQRGVMVASSDRLGLPA